jgi:non-specific serine/threonine protein kinase
MDTVPLGLSLTPHGRLALTPDADAPPLNRGLADRLRQAFERGPGHGLLLLGADEPGTALPPVYSYWREFGAHYVTALCTRQDTDASIPAPSDEELERLALAAPPMTGAEYLTAAVLDALWRELDAAFGIELSASKLGV